jgi:hypothetical protein
VTRACKKRKRKRKRKEKEEEKGMINSMSLICEHPYNYF